ncbi:hypothetical protein [Fluviicola sp.]|uniref:hypothetical protein n=1 Tax=Fluviicola sp. TaxID=1917219 RepID=UPI0026308DCF|nr:hypothetical protein [Fluviicola sp.]
MKHIATCIVGIFLILFQGNAQVCPPEKAKNNTSEPDETSGTLPIKTDAAYLDLNKLNDLVAGKRRNVFRFGYGINAIIRMDRNQTGFRTMNDLSWYNDRVGHVFDFSGEMGSRSRWLLGFSFGFQKLGQMNQSKSYLPEEYGQGGSGSENFPLEATFELKARTFTPLLYTEYRFMAPWKGFSGFVRADMGMTIYRAYMEVSYRDSCGCQKVPVSDWEMSTAFHAGFGIGVNWEYRFIGVKTLIGYQMQTKVKFRERDAYENYTFAFDPAQYEFKGNPGDNRFSIQKSGSAAPRSYNPLYFQVMIYFRLISK